MTFNTRDSLELTSLPPKMTRYFYYLMNSKVFVKKSKTVRMLIDNREKQKAEALLNELIAYYEIPNCYALHITHFILKDKIFTGAPINYLPVVTYGVPVTTLINVDAPAICLFIHGPISKTEFESLWASVDSFQSPNNPIGNMFKKTYTKHKSKELFDRDFHWYKLKQTGLRYIDIKVREETRGISVETIKNAVIPLKNLIKKIHRETESIK